MAASDEFLPPSLVRSVRADRHIGPRLGPHFGDLARTNARNNNSPGGSPARAEAVLQRDPNAEEGQRRRPGARMVGCGTLARVLNDRRWVGWVRGARYLPSYLPTHLPTYLRTYVPTYLPTYLPSYLPTYPPTYVPTHLPTYPPTYVPTVWATSAVLADRRAEPSGSRRHSSGLLCRAAARHQALQPRPPVGENSYSCSSAWPFEWRESTLPSAAAGLPSGGIPESSECANRPTTDGCTLGSG